MYLFLANNLFITSTLVIGGGAVINALSGNQLHMSRSPDNVMLHPSLP